MVNMRGFILILGCAAGLAAQPVFAQRFNIDFSGQYSSPSSSYGAAAGQAGVWNAINPGGAVALNDLSGGLTAVTITVSGAVEGWAGTSCGGDLGALISDDFYNNGPTWSVVVNGLSNGSYTVYLYSPMHPSESTGTMTVNGTPAASIKGLTCGLTLGENYETVQATVTSGTLTIDGTLDVGGPYNIAGLSGLQIATTQAAIPVGSPVGYGAAALLVVLIGCGFLLRRRA